ncbi:LysE family translocator [Vibrio sp. SCSIO 43135]|uniref:LysE family translocator n=1 Tax=Vibrio sp. SCSIO 43135 TaxID=2819096 RepID=UPI002074EF71|nr:LysE family translocator [Vibrio sp. SCSIO 43135]USD43352.1 LysE family translocator [Vibrio sp. SCSIO 43135]
MQFEVWLIYLVAVVGVSLVPGPNGLLALTHGLTYGRQQAKYTVLGGVVGFSLLITLALSGIGVLLSLSESILIVMKVLGGGYLIWLGYKLLKQRAEGIDIGTKTSATSRYTLFKTGFITAIANPKVLLFFASFLPQFLNPNIGFIQQWLVLAVTFVAVEFCVEYLLVVSAHTMRGHLQNKAALLNKISGGLFIGFGVLLPVV